MTPQRRDGNAEARIQASIVAYVRLVLTEGICAAIPNGGLRSKSEAARMRWTGTLAGIPDLIILTRGRACFLEVKTDKGSLSPEQRTIHEQLALLGIPCAVVRSIDDAREAFRQWGIPVREVVG